MGEQRPARGEPRVSGADGHFLHGRWIFGTDRSAAKARHFAARPAVSAAYLRGEELGVFTHGRVEELNPPGAPADPHWPAILEHLTEHYGTSPYSWGDVVYYRIRPDWMVVFAADPRNCWPGPADRAGRGAGPGVPDGLPGIPAQPSRTACKV